MLRAVDTGLVRLHAETSRHTARVPSRREAWDALARVIAHLPEQAADDLAAEIEALRLALGVPNG